MFQYSPDSDELTRPTQSFVPEVTPGAGDYDKLDPAQLIHTALGKDLNLGRTLDAVDAAEKIKDQELRMIAAVGPTPKAQEMAKKALYHREHPDQRAGTSLICEIFDNSDEGEGEEKGADAGVVVRMRRPLVQPTEESEEVEKQPETPQSQPPVVEKTETWHEMFISVLLFVWKMGLSALDYVAAFLNRRSREHRYVAYVLAKEKERLKSLMHNELYDAERTPSQVVLVLCVGGKGMNEMYISAATSLGTIQHAHRHQRAGHLPSGGRSTQPLAGAQHLRSTADRSGQLRSGPHRHPLLLHGRSGPCPLCRPDHTPTATAGVFLGLPLRSQAVEALLDHDDCLHGAGDSGEVLLPVRVLGVEHRCGRGAAGE